MGNSASGSNENNNNQTAAAATENGANRHHHGPAHNATNAATPGGAPGRLGGIGRGAADGDTLYRYVDMHGGGELLLWQRLAATSGDASIFDSVVDTKIAEHMYGNGKGKMMSIVELVKLRNKERNAMLGAFARKKGKGKSGPNVLDAFNQEDENAGDIKKALKLLDGGGKGGKNELRYREVIWKLEERGSMGENLVHVALLQGSPNHNQIAEKLIAAYPKLINDICVSEDYYGLSPLHQAIINQDPRMVALLLRKGADVNARCYGAFFCAEDQKSSRTDSLEHEWVELPVRTNYTGTMYFGEYPLSFACCMNQSDCYRLLIAYRANPNAQDTNGNTLLHLCVIHENLDMMRLGLATGASLKIVNRQNLTPLTLAAKLAKRTMFEAILELEGECMWTYGNAAQMAYPLSKIDTINEETGDVNETSALALAVYGPSPAHLDLLDGLLENLLDEKWSAFGKKEWIKSLGFFICYYITFTVAFVTRPITDTTTLLSGGAIIANGTVTPNTAYFAKAERFYMCNLMEYSSPGAMGPGWGYVRLASEVLVLAMVIIQIGLDVKDIRRIGRKKWFTIVYAFPAKIMYKVSYFCVLAIIPFRLGCALSDFMLFMDNALSMLSVLLTTVHFMYYCRAIKFVGPFVLMIYTIVAQDMSRFLVIYLIFLLGFTQSFYVIFTACNRVTIDPSADFDNILNNPFEAMIRTFTMTMGEFMNFYKELSSCESVIMTLLGKIVFLIFELFVSILQFNLLIAMMTRTYEMISQTSKEWKRQWAQVILMLELSLGPEERRLHLLKYSRPTGANKKMRSYVVARKTSEGHDSAAGESAHGNWRQRIGQRVAAAQSGQLKGRIT